MVSNGLLSAVLGRPASCETVPLIYILFPFSKQVTYKARASSFEDLSPPVLLLSSGKHENDGKQP
jgi:hypothetical protein